MFVNDPQIQIKAESETANSKTFYYII